MSWEDYTKARCFGWIGRPYSDLLAEIVDGLDALIGAQPVMSRSFVNMYSRDTVFIRGSKIFLVAISRAIQRQYPTFLCPEMSGTVSIPEDDLIAKSGLSEFAAVRVTDQGMISTLSDKFGLVDPVVFSVPAIVSPQFGSQAFDIQARAKSEASQLLWKYEIEVYNKMVEDARPKDIFLSHKSVDKPLVREVANTLTAAGFSPWLDEDRMKRAPVLERALREGMATSCAAVFFITPDFKDEGFPETEIDYALEEKRSKGDRFVIVSLQIRSASGSVGQVPQILRRHKYFPVEPIEIVRTILDALPVCADRIVWRPGV